VNFDEIPKKVLSAISSSTRVKILQLLSRQSPLPFTQIMQMMNLEPTTDAGRFGYHLRELKTSNLIKGDESGYNLTELGKKIVEFIWGLIDYSRSEIIKEIPVRTSEYAIDQFDRKRITESLIREAGVPNDLAEEIAKETEEQLMNAEVKYLTAPLIREVVNSILVLKGHEQYRHKLTRLGLPPFEILRILKDSNTHPINSNPETVQKLVSDAIFEQNLLLNILPMDIADAHLRGDISIPNANFFILRPNSIQHDLRPFFAEGFIADKDSLAVSLNPPKNFNQALMLTAKLIEFSQIHTSGTQSFDFFNIFLAPFIKNLSREQIKENLFLFFKELGSTYIGPGGQLPYSTLNLEYGIPKFLINTPIVGNTIGCYGDYLDESLKLLDVILDVLIEGDHHGKPFFYPHQIFKIRKKALTDPEIESLLLKTHELVIKWGTPFLANLTLDWQTSNVNYTGVFDRLDCSWKDDYELDTLRTGNLDSVFINLPRIAYESKQNDDTFLEKLEERIQIAISALTIKRNQLYMRLFEDRILPLLTYPIKGENYFRLECSTNAISYVGLPDAIELHTDSKISTKTGLKFAQTIIKNLQELLIKKTENTGVRWVLRQPFSHNWVERFLQLDNKRFNPKKETKIFKPFNFYNTSNINTDLPLTLPEKLKLESAFHKHLTGGHLMVLPLLESLDSIESVLDLTKKICRESIGLLTYAYNLTYCIQCGKTFKGTPKRCPICNTTQNISYFNKIMGPYQSYEEFSKSERIEVRNRQKFSL